MKRIFTAFLCLFAMVGMAQITLPFEYKEGDFPTGMTGNGLGRYVDIKTKLKFDKQGDELILSLPSLPQSCVLEYNIKRNGGENQHNIFDVECSNNGTTYTILKHYTNNFATNLKHESLQIPAATISIRFKYTQRKKRGNVGIGMIKINSLLLIIGESGYTTFYCGYPYKMPTGLTGNTVKVSGMNVTLTPSYASGSNVPANTPLLISGTEGNHTATILTETVPAFSGTNLLKGTLTEQAITAPSGGMVYVFAKDDTDGLGFYWQNGTTGTTLTNAAGKCYLEVSGGSGVQGFRLDGTLTAIEAAATEKADEQIYDLSGRRVNNAGRGLYIVNGKKVIR